MTTETTLRELEPAGRHRRRAAHPKAFFQDYMLPKIASGDARDTVDRVKLLARQARITPETETRLLYLIEEFQGLTK